jgi:hypothetical protein
MFARAKHHSTAWISLDPPDRDFVYLWNASRRDLITGMGGIVTCEPRPSALPALDGDLPRQRLSASHRRLRRRQQPSI